MDTKLILDKLDKGEISVKEACKKIKEDSNVIQPSVKSSKLKIIIINKKEGKNIKIPAIPFWMISGLGNLGLKISSFVAKYSDDDDIVNSFKILDNINLKEIFDVLRYQDPSDIIHIINDDDKSEIKISTL